MSANRFTTPMVRTNAKADRAAGERDIGYRQRRLFSDSAATPANAPGGYHSRFTSLRGEVATRIGLG
jgi:hypothetical protein